MSVEITFEPAGLTGLVAEGSSIADAARRMGLVVFFECKGTGDCTCCQVSVVRGADLLSAPNDAEERILGVEGLQKQQRLACQTRIERPGELIVEFNPEKDRTEKAASEGDAMRKRFGELPLNKKIATLMQLEALTMYEAMNALVDKPLAFGEKMFDKILNKTRSTQQQRPNQQSKN
jgi:ferredoxin